MIFGMIRTCYDIVHSIIHGPMYSWQQFVEATILVGISWVCDNRIFYTYHEVEVCVCVVCVWQGSLWRTVQGMMFHLVGFIASGIYPCLILDTVRWDMGDNW